MPTGHQHHHDECFWSVYSATAIDQSRKCHNSPTPYPIMHHSEQTCARYCHEWCIVKYRNGQIFGRSICMEGGNPHMPLSTTVSHHHNRNIQCLCTWSEQSHINAFLVNNGQMGWNLFNIAIISTLPGLYHPVITLCIYSRGPFCLHGLTFVPAKISNRMPNSLWD